MIDYILSLHKTLASIEKDLGGDISFIKPVSESTLELFEQSISWKLPDVFRHFYLNETNGIIIGNKRIYSLFQTTEKKTFVENLERINNPKTSPWFKGRPHIFNDYLIVANDIDMIFCLSKKYEIGNPAIYLCKHPNNKKSVEFSNLGLDLQSIISEMVRQEFDF